VLSSSVMWGCSPPVPTGVLATTRDATREAHGVGSGAVRTNWCSLWSMEKEHWNKPGWEKAHMIR